MDNLHYSGSLFAFSDAGERRPYEGPSSNITYLSLFFILLAFFILMNAISSFEEKKVTQVSAVVKDSFSTQKISRFASGDGAGDKTAGDYQGIRPEQEFNFIRDLIPNTKKKFYEKSNVLEYRFTQKIFFVDQSVDIRPDYDQLVNRLVGSLRKDRLAATVVLEILYGQTRKNTESDAYRLGVDRLSSLAQKMIGRGLPAQQFSVGISESLGQDVIIRFRVISRDPSAEQALKGGDA